MPQTTGFGEKLGGVDRDPLFASLVSKDESIKFRIIAPPFYDGKHFLKDQETGKWVVSYCPKVMETEFCEYCQKYFEFIKAAKKITDTAKQVQAIKEANYFKSKIQFYYPIIDRESEQARILKTSLSIRIKVDAEVKLGVDVTKFDYVMTRTEKPGSEYYTLIRIDSSMTKPFSEKEQKEFEIAKAWDLKDMVGNVKQSEEDLLAPTGAAAGEVKPGEEPKHDETVNPEDIPF